MPISFWVVIALLIGGGLWSLRHLNSGTGLPMLAVLGTTLAWYVGDAFYNDYPNNHAKLFSAACLRGAWWQVAWFLFVFLVATPGINRWMNARYLHRKSGAMQLFQHGVGDPTIQKQLHNLFWGCCWVWTMLALIALIILKGEIIYYLFPFLDQKITPWTHARIGAGFDAFSILAMYLQLLSATMFGVVAALATNPRLRRLGLLFCLLAWPYFIFDRTRNTMLAMVIPAILSWVFLRLRGGFIKKGLILLVFFLLVNTWMKFVIANRVNGSIAGAFRQKGLTEEKHVHNEGLNMFEELCWISKFIDNGKYQVNWGKRYFAELVNPIPRGLWHNKPLIGVDYAIARGQGGGSADQAGIYASISTGFIGGGVVNFGRFLGPAAAALLMSLWAAWLARLDLNIQALGRLPLYSLGLILTFNLGRDITLITLYPFVFGALAIWWLEHQYPQLGRSGPELGTKRPAHQLPATRQRFLFARRSTKGGFVKRKSSRNPHASTNQ